MGYCVRPIPAASTKNRPQPKWVGVFQSLALGPRGIGKIFMPKVDNILNCWLWYRLSNRALSGRRL